MEQVETDSLTATRLRQLEGKNEVALQGGGENRIGKHKEGGRLTARERLDVLLDPGSFVEIDRFVSHRCDNFGMGEKRFLATAWLQDTVVLMASWSTSIARTSRSLVEA